MAVVDPGRAGTSTLLNLFAFQPSIYARRRNRDTQKSERCPKWIDRRVEVRMHSSEESLMRRALLHVAIVLAPVP